MPTHLKLLELLEMSKPCRRWLLDAENISLDVYPYRLGVGY